MAGFTAAQAEFAHARRYLATRQSGTFLFSLSCWFCYADKDAWRLFLERSRYESNLVSFTLCSPPTDWWTPTGICRGVLSGPVLCSCICVRKGALVLCCCCFWISQWLLDWCTEKGSTGWHHSQIYSNVNSSELLLDRCRCLFYSGYSGGLWTILITSTWTDDNDRERSLIVRGH